MLASLLLALPFPANGGQPLAAPTLTTPGTPSFTEEANFRYIINTRKHLGDDPAALEGTFVGDDLEITFDLPLLYPIPFVTERAVLMLQTRGVTVNCNVIKINGVDVSSALRAHDDDSWHTQIGEVPPNVLKSGSNTLQIAARNESCGVGGNLDDFVVDNVVILYRKP